MHAHQKIPVFAINLKSQVDRFKSIYSEFLTCGSFQLEIVRAIELTYGA